MLYMALTRMDVCVGSFFFYTFACQISAIGKDRKRTKRAERETGQILLDFKDFGRERKKTKSRSIGRRDFTASIRGAAADTPWLQSLERD